ncbi:BatD family protein [Dysgonomonas sp. Marseille-P4677]|uniref:BatD family protein n=1 Tax=Dysgonomonas sp. Marseille-P4677 TaxID=2364790 RepID=UPI001912D58D|nr:BatD family protein [Dysgonomonas sp. Marseille-P4677]MBK5721598.1 BatD family protein [Dysgonomonas sp. Marseille-P4677]
MKTGYSHSMCRFVLSVVLLLPFLSFVSGQNLKINIKAPETVFVGEQFRVDYVVESESEVREPIIIKNMEDFSILYGPSVSSSAVVGFKNGKRIVTYTTTSSYYLEARKEGKYTLPKAEIIYRGKKYKSDVYKLEVRSVKKVADEVDAFVKTIVSRSSVNLSDTLMLTYRLYTTKDIERVINADFPDIDGFYTTNITRSRQSFQDETIDGKVYKVVDLRVLILQPRRVGQMIIPEGQISVQYSTPTGRKVRDMWGDVYNETIKSDKTLNIDSVIIRVQDLKAI